MNLYDYAIQMSRDGEDFFRTLTKQVKNPGLRKILIILANDQATHRRDFAKKKKAEGMSLAEAGNLDRSTQSLRREAEEIGPWGKNRRKSSPRGTVPEGSGVGPGM